MAREMDFVDECYADKDLSQLRQVTIIIPTHNRNYYLSRCLWYHAHFPFGEIIVADSSDEEKREINQKTINDIQESFSTKIKHLIYTFPLEEYGGEIYRKWGDAINHVDTQYSLSCTDKEFLIPTSVCGAVTFLDDHPDYSIADGIYIKVEKFNLVYPWQSDPSFSSDEITLRLQKLLLFKSGVGTQFALRRSSQHKLMFENISKYDLYDIRFGEIAIELFPILTGRTYREKSSYMSVRDVIEGRRKSFIVAAESSFLRYPFISEYPVERYSLLMNRLSDFIRDISFQSISKEMVYDIIRLYLRYRAVNRRAISYVFSLLPYNIRLVLSRLLGGGEMTQKLTRHDKTPEIRLIIKIINISSKYHDGDIAVHHCF